jgi:hypothetical protein
MTTKNEMHHGKRGSTITTGEQVMNWSPEELTRQLASKGVPIGDVFIRHRIDGKVVSMLTDKEYEKFGFEAIGDLLHVKRAVASIQQSVRSYKRHQILWEKGEFIDASCWDNMVGSYANCCTTQPKLGKYTLATTSLAVTSYAKSTTNFFLQCFATNERKVDNVPLSLIQDVDIDIETPSCYQATCCSIKGTSRVIVQYVEEGKPHELTLFLKPEDGVEAQKMIRDAIDENSSKV